MYVLNARFSAWTNCKPERLWRAGKPACECDAGPRVRDHEASAIVFKSEPCRACALGVVQQIHRTVKRLVEPHVDQVNGAGGERRQTRKRGVAVVIQVLHRGLKCIGCAASPRSVPRTLDL